MTVAQDWVAALATIGLWSWLIDRQSPVFDMVEYLFIGLALCYTIALQYSDYLLPALKEIGKGQWALIIPILIGLLIYARFFKSIEYLSRWAVSYFVGYGAGYVLAFTPAVFLGQVSGSFFKLWGSQPGAVTAENWIIFIVLIACLLYFFFTVNRSGALMKGGTLLGRYAIMAALGFTFGATVLYRYSLLFGRVYFIFHTWLHVV
jgi:hypothetical protein